MDVICFTHLRWNFVYQRPQHLLRRLAKHFRVFFIEEPVFEGDRIILNSTLSKEGVWVVIPHLPKDLPNEVISDTIEGLLHDFFRDLSVNEYIFWYYTPLPLSFTASFTPLLTVYDCMDELSAFKFAPA